MAIDAACFAPGIAYGEDEMREFLALPSAATFVAEELLPAKDSRILAFLISDKFRSRHTNARTGRIITIDVHPQAQHRGLGSQLLTAAEEDMKRAGCAQVVLEVAVDNATALSFYKKHGYMVQRTLPRYYLDSIDGLQMGKPL